VNIAFAVDVYAAEEEEVAIAEFTADADVTSA